MLSLFTFHSSKVVVKAVIFISFNAKVLIAYVVLHVYAFASQHFANILYAFILV